jgi:lipopolysaccharide export system protein LptC
MQPAVNETPPPRPAKASAESAAPTPPPRLSLRDRYSIFVGLMKIFLPAMATALVLLVVAWPQLKVDTGFRLGLSDLSLEDAENLTMLNARFDGSDDQNQPYRLTADLATQRPGDENLIDLERPAGDMTLTSGTWLALTARSGRYNRNREILDLTGDVNLFHDGGFELRSESARVDLEAGTARGDQPVEGQGSAGLISGEGFRVLDRGERIIFTGKSQLVLYPDAKEAGL